MRSGEPKQQQASEEGAREVANFVFGSQWYENAELAQLPRLLKDTSVFVDVGASVGPYTQRACEIMSNGQIVAIEANQDNFQRLAACCRDWEKSSTNRIRCLHAAAGNEPGQVEFFIPNSDASLVSSLVQSAPVNGDWRKVTVASLTLDETVGDLRPGLIKIDVEGAEVRVLEGARRILERGEARFLVEIHPWGDPQLGKRPVDVFRLFYQFGYDFDRVARHWHFVKAAPSLKRTLKYWAISFIQRNAGLKEALKKLVLKIDAWRERR